MNILIYIYQNINGDKMEKQKIACNVHDCKFCNCDCDECTLKEIKVCNCNQNQDKESTMCNSYEFKKN